MVNNQIYKKAFIWLFIGLMISFVGGYYLSLNENLALKLVSFGALPILVVELIIAFLMGLRIQKMQPITAKIFYIVFSITTGITLSTIFLIYKMSSLIFIFLITAIIFAILAFYGYITKRDLSKFGVIITIALIVVIITSLLNMFIFKSGTTNTIISAVSVLIFCGYIAYDMNKVKQLYPVLGEEKTPVFLAFQLYLDFINLFISLLELFGNSKDN